MLGLSGYSSSDSDDAPTAAAVPRRRVSLVQLPLLLKRRALSPSTSSGGAAARAIAAPVVASDAPKRKRGASSLLSMLPAPKHSRTSAPNLLAQPLKKSVAVPVSAPQLQVAALAPEEQQEEGGEAPTPARGVAPMQGGAGLPSPGSNNQAIEPKPNRKM